VKTLVRIEEERHCRFSALHSKLPACINRTPKFREAMESNALEAAASQPALR